MISAVTHSLVANTSRGLKMRSEPPVAELTKELEMVNVRPVQTSVARCVEEIVDQTIGHTNLSLVTQWIASAGNSDGIVDVVTQDEYTHDVVVRYAEGIYLVYDVS